MKKAGVQNTFKRHVCNIVLSIFTRRSCLIRSCNIRNNTHTRPMQTKRHRSVCHAMPRHHTAFIAFIDDRSTAGDHQLLSLAKSQLLCSLYQDKVEECIELWVGFMSLIQHLTTALRFYIYTYNEQDGLVNISFRIERSTRRVSFLNVGSGGLSNKQKRQYFWAHNF